ncbi:TetR/AcrR family transcriptional regulator [Oceanobacillus kimchii]|uniref:TetR/AcrR family transcriptional regulator n=1 Tax=Oceanobacillus TaxID=182709 RepID=UPI001BE7F80F|nr:MULTISPECIES: TetR/AcrR family transcriptional regulator [Oceanobacillus]MBT2599796.1 TetR/AcrR family transcriptional regulator [Oceanobacillus sp. ISL-74]MCT1576978.1 TetR/AcrR family transcriptional regulator [Oceanobacillus kimchii]MCT2135048.1 TetR/AcrR family transcriptional regulator [Oceanobacillus kimchii]
MQNNSSTPRKDRTKMHFQQALITLTKEKGFHSVSVKDIVQYAKYNRSTFYVHYKDKFELADDLLCTNLVGLEESFERPYKLKREVNTDLLNNSSFHIISSIYSNREFYDLINYVDTIPELHTKFPQTILKMYQEKFEFKTLNNLPVNMDYFKRYTAYGFYGLLANWINTGFQTPQEELIKEVIMLTQTHMASVKYIGEH